MNCIFQANLINKTVYLIKLQRTNAFVSSIVLKTKVLIEVIIFTSPTSADPPPTHPPFTWSLEPREGLANFRGKGSTFIYQLFQDPKKGPIQPTNSRFADKRCMGCADPAAGFSTPRDFSSFQNKKLLDLL